ncbi:MAG TPA: CoA-binding protein [Vicinamibacterales bacterium]|nr:CoA-binding protein [Vicinamibacterales bacterium]
MPKTVAVVGASSNRGKFGNKAFRAFRQKGYTVIPVNPNEREVEGTRTVASVLDIAGDLDMVTVYVPPDVGVRIMNDVAKKGVKELWLNPGADDDAVIARARELGLEPIVACSIVGIGENPYRY